MGRKLCTLRLTISKSNRVARPQNYVDISSSMSNRLKYATISELDNRLYGILTNPSQSSPQMIETLHLTNQLGTLVCPVSRFNLRTRFTRIY